MPWARVQWTVLLPAHRTLARDYGHVHHRAPAHEHVDHRRRQAHGAYAARALGGCARCRDAARGGLARPDDRAARQLFRGADAAGAQRGPREHRVHVHGRESFAGCVRRGFTAPNGVHRRGGLPPRLSRPRLPAVGVRREERGRRLAQGDCNHAGEQHALLPEAGRRRALRHHAHLARRRRGAPRVREGEWHRAVLRGLLSLLAGLRGERHRLSHGGRAAAPRAPGSGSTSSRRRSSTAHCT